MEVTQWSSYNENVYFQENFSLEIFWFIEDNIWSALRSFSYFKSGIIEDFTNTDISIGNWL